MGINSGLLQECLEASTSAPNSRLSTTRLKVRTSLEVFERQKSAPSQQQDVSFPNTNAGSSTPGSPAKARLRLGTKPLIQTSPQRLQETTRSATTTGVHSDSADWSMRREPAEGSYPSRAGQVAGVDQEMINHLNVGVGLGRGELGDEHLTRAGWAIRRLWGWRRPGAGQSRPAGARVGTEGHRRLQSETAPAG